MHRSRSGLCAVSVALLALICPVTASGAAITWVPSGLNPGDTYHLVFITSGTRDASSANINDYNTFVDNAMGAIDDASLLGDIEWKCIGSTSSIEAKENIDYGLSGLSSSPVYRLDGSKIADDSDDLWDGDVIAPINVDENLQVGAANYVWTGTRSSGQASSPLGYSNWSVTYGEPNMTNYWVNRLSTAEKPAWPFYGFSEELTKAGGGGGAIPEPRTIALSLMGLVAGAALRRRRGRSSK